jgi:hypothetical protein
MAAYGASSPLLIRTGSRFAVVEQRAGRIYPMKPGARQGKPLTPDGLAAAMVEQGWLPEDEARRQFGELCDRSDRLARSLLSRLPDNGFSPRHPGLDARSAGHRC